MTTSVSGLFLSEVQIQYLAVAASTPGRSVIHGVWVIDGQCESFRVQFDDELLAKFFHQLVPLLTPKVDPSD